MAADNKDSPAAEGSWLAGELKALGDARDGIIVAIAVVYILGFLSWAIYSWRHHLGFVQILDAQYLVAGIPAAPVVLAVYLPWRLAATRPDDQSLLDRVDKVGLALTSIAFVGELTFLLTSYFPRFWPFDRAISEFVVYYIAEVSLLILAASSLFRPDPARSLLLSFPDAPPRRGTPHGPRVSRASSEEKRAGEQRTNDLPQVDSGSQLPNERSVPPGNFVVYWGLYCILFALFPSGIWYYVWGIYPHLPQELGGARPVCADLVLDAKRAPLPLLDRLGIVQPPARLSDHLFGGDPAAPPVRVRLLYNGEKAVFFTTGADDNHEKSFEVAKDLVVGIIDCAE